MLLTLTAHAAIAQTWQPTRPIDVTVAYAQGGGTDQMMRTIQAIVEKHGLSPQPLVIVNQPGGGGGEAMLALKGAPGDPHKLLAIAAAIYMTPLSMPFPASWRDFTPVAMLAREHFVLWTHADASLRSAADLLAMARGATPPKIGGAGSRREDHLIALSLAREASGTITYVAYAGGRPASVQLAARHIDATTGNPSEELDSWRAGTARPLCVLSPARIAHDAKVVGDAAWSDVPTCAEQGVVFTYSMPRGVFLPGRVDESVRRFYAELFTRVVATPEWARFAADAALLQDFRVGGALIQHLEAEEARHRDLMRDVGLLAR